MNNPEDIAILTARKNDIVVKLGEARAMVARLENEYAKSNFRINECI